MYLPTPQGMVHRFHFKYMDFMGLKRTPWLAAVLLVPVVFNIISHAWWVNERGLTYPDTYYPGYHVIPLVSLPLWIAVAVPAILNGFCGSKGVVSAGGKLPFPGRYLLIGSWLAMLLGWVVYRHMAFFCVGPGESDSCTYRNASWGSTSVTIAFLAMVSMQFFLLPICRSSPLLALLKVDPAVAVEYHRLWGWWMYIFLCGHVFLYWVEWYTRPSTGSRWDATPTGTPGGWTRIWQESTSTSTGVPYLAGLLGFLTLNVMIVTALPKVRRAYFELFMYTHRLGAAFFLIFASLHWDGMLVWSFGNICLYLADYASQLRQFFYPLPVLSAREAGGVLTIRLPCQTPPKPLQWLSINAPGVTGKQWHTFSVATATHNSFTIVPKVVPGGWTQDLCKHLIEEQGKQLRVSNFYNEDFAPEDWEAETGPYCFVAGGSGVVCFTYLLQVMSQAQSRPEVQLIMICRTKTELMEYARIADLANVRQRMPELQVNLYVDGPKTEEVIPREVSQESPRILYPPNNNAFLAALCHIFVPLCSFACYWWMQLYGSQMLVGQQPYNKTAGLLKLVMILAGAAIGAEISLLLANMFGKPAPSARDLEMTTALHGYEPQEPAAGTSVPEYTEGRPDLEKVIGPGRKGLRVYVSGPPPLLGGVRTAVHNLGYSLEEFSFAL